MTRLLLGFALRFVVFYLVVELLWIGLADPYAVSFCKVGQATLRAIGYEARLEQLEEPEGRHDCLLTVGHRPTRTIGRIKISSHMLGYVCLAFIVALVAATPIPWRRRMWNLLWALLLVTAYSAARLYVVAANAYAQLQPDASSWLGYIEETIAQSPAGCFVGPILLWILISFRSKDLKDLWERLQTRLPAS